jgi:cell division protein FtsB
VLAAQKTAVEDLKQQLRDVNDRVEIVKRRARVEGAMVRGGQSV